MLRWYVPSLSLPPSCSPLLLSPCLLIQVHTTVADVHEYYYQEHTYLQSLHLWYQLLLPGRPQAPTTSTDVVISNHPRMSLHPSFPLSTFLPSYPLLSPPLPSPSYPLSRFHPPLSVVAETNSTTAWYDI